MHAAHLSEWDRGWVLRSVWRDASPPPLLRPRADPGVDNGLSAAELERLALLSEECAEAIHAVGKIPRLGWEIYDPTRGRSPASRRMLVTQLADIQFAVSLLAQAADFSPRNMETAISARLANPGPYMHSLGLRPGVAVAGPMRLTVGLSFGRCRFRSCRVDRLEWRWCMTAAVQEAPITRFAPMPPVCRHPEPVQACRACGCWRHDGCVAGDEELCRWAESDLCSLSASGAGTGPEMLSHVREFPA